jgi:hypothetical protein
MFGGMTFLRLSLALMLLFGNSAAWAQATAGNAVRNGGFERTIQTANIWGGTDRDGYLVGARASLPVLMGKGEISAQPMPVSVAVGDMNGDGKLDIMAADPQGFIRIYFNSGSPQEPKFNFGELTTPYLTISDTLPPWTPSGVLALSYEKAWSERRRGIRIGLVDTGNTGKLDLVAGNYFGEIFFVPNRGSPQSPQFQQPDQLTKAMLPTMKDPNHRWGNLFAPLLFDWDSDRRPDLLIGEGSYSANNIHLFLNQGSPAAPAFSEEKSQVLALGEGRQQLHPALADVDGDGTMDLLVADREGLVTAYLRPKTWKVGDAIRPTGFLGKNGGLTQESSEAFTLGSGINTISTGDLNGDGLFDLIVGKPNGRVAWSPNKGSKDKPKFEPPKDIQGDKNSQATWTQPSGWEIDLGVNRGNFYVYANCPTAQDDPAAQPKEGTRAVKFGYDVPSKSVIPPPVNLVFAPPARKQAKGATDQLRGTTMENLTVDAPSNRIVMRQEIALQIGTTYNLSMQIKGSKVLNGKAYVAWTASKETGEAREVRGERGSIKRVVNRISDKGEISIDLRPGASWGKAGNKFKVEFAKEKELNNEKTATGTLIIMFELGKPDGTLYLDDVSLVPDK